MDRSRAMNSRSIEALLNTGGRPLSEADRGFVQVLMRELQQFQSQAPKDRALMFHPLSGYQRYLIHRVTELFPKLSSFTIDTDDKRRTVVCFKSKRKEQQMQHGQIPPGRRGTPVREPKALRSGSKVKSNGPSPAKERPHHSEPESRSKLGKYNTISNDAVRKRQQGLNLEGQVVNGEQPKSDVEGTRRKSRPDSRKKHRTKRSLSQPHLNDRRESRHREDSLVGSSDNPNSDEEMNHKPRHTKSATNIPDKRRTKSRKKDSLPVGRTEPVVSKHVFDEIYQSSGPEISHQGDQSPSDNDENEIPPSYEKMSQEAKEKAMRNLMRIKRTNSIKSCPPLEQPKHDYVNSEAALLRKENRDSSYYESPVFHRKHSNGEPKGKSEATPEKKTKDRSKKKKKAKNKVSDGASKEYVNLPKEVRCQDSYESSPFDSSWIDNPDPPANSSAKEVAAVIEKVPSLDSIIDSQVDSVTNDMKQLPGNLEDTVSAQPPSPMVSVIAVNNGIAPIDKHVDKETQTDLHGSLVDKMTSAYNASLNPVSHVAPPTLSNDFIRPAKQSSLNMTSGASTPNVSSPSSAYEKLGEYMFKAVMNFQNMLAEGQAAPQSQEFRTPTGTDPFRTTPVYPTMPHPAQPVLVPWMPPFYADPIAARPQVLTCTSQSVSAEHCCHHQKTNSSFTKGRSRSKGGSFTSVSSRDDGSNHRARRSRSSKGMIPNHVVSDHTQLVTRRADAFDSDASSEITNPELTVAEGGDGLMVYVRNSNRSTSSAAGSVADTPNNLPGANEDARASPLGHDHDDVFNKLLKPKSSNESGANDKKMDASNKSEKSGKKLSKDKPAVENEIDPMKEMIPLPINAPLAKMDDVWSSHSSSSSTSRHSSLPERESLDAEIARSLVGEDLDPLVCFDDNLEMACEDGTAEH